MENKINFNSTDCKLTIKKVVKPKEGSHTDRLIFVDLIQNNSSEKLKSLVIKVFNNIENFQFEENKLKESSNLIKSANHMCAIKKGTFQQRSPHFIECVESAVAMNNTNPIGAILLTEAKGSTIDDLLSRESVSSMSKEEISAIFMNIGRQLGTLDVLYYSNHRKLLKHPDTKGSNFMYDTLDDQLYFIDLAGIDVIDINDDQLPQLEIVYDLLIRDIGNSIYTFSFCNEMFDEKMNNNERSDFLKKEEDNIRKKLLAFESIFTGYELALDSNNIKYNAKESFQNHINQNSKVGEDRDYIRGAYKRFTQYAPEGMLFPKELDI